MNYQMLLLISILFISAVVSEKPENQTIPRVEETYAIKGCENTPGLCLTELWNDFNLVFAQHTKNSTCLINLNKKGQVKIGTCTNTTEMTLKHLCRMDDKFGSGYFFNRTTKEMIQNPKARLYWEKNFQGSSEDLVREQEGMCRKLANLRWHARSVETFGSCIRVFSNSNCKGWSLAIYPGSKSSRDVLNAQLKTINSIGPCFDDEFVLASFEDVLKRTIVKNHKFINYSPDLLQFRSVNFYNAVYEYSDNFEYALGQNNRVEHFSFKANAVPIPTTNNNSETRISTEIIHFYESLEKEDGDEMTFAIPLSIGGPSQNFNVFPASKDCVEKWNEIISYKPQGSIVDQIEMDFAYESESSTRPMFFYYHIGYERDDSWLASFGRVLNGNPVKVNAHAKPQPIQKIPKKIQDTWRICLPQLAGIFKNRTNDTTRGFSNSSLTNFNEPKANLSSKSNCQVFLSFEDIQESPEISDGSFVPDDYIQDMVGSKFFKGAILFSGPNLTGKATKLLWKKSQCADAATVETRVESVLTFGKCIRLHDSHYCYGKSLAVYPGSGNSHAVLQFGLGEVKRIGICQFEEFVNSTFSQASKRHISKDGSPSPYLPNLLNETWAHQN